MPRYKHVPIDTLHEDPKNARSHPERNKAAVRASLEEFGQVEALVVQAGTGKVIGGNCRLAVLREMGVEKVKVSEVDVNDKQATRLGLILNRSAETAEWDTDNLAELLKELDEDDLLEGLGWDDGELEAILADPDPGGSGGGDPGPPEVQPEAVSVLGEVYELGPHRLVCGDCTDFAVRDALLGGERTDVVLTDPPYGIDASAMTMGSGQSSRPQSERLSAVSAWDGRAPPVAWLLDEAALACVWGANYFSDLPVSDDWLVWHKKNDGLSFAEAELAWSNFGRRVRVLQHHWSHEVKEHITQKPLPVILWCLTFIPEAKVVFDPFAGSGTTLIACAETGRVARCIELDPRYCDVIRRRWTSWAIEHNADPGPGALE